MLDSEGQSSRGRDYTNLVLTMSKNGVNKTDGFEFQQRDESWYVSTDTPSDCLIQIEGVSFHLHKFPLISKSGKISRLIDESYESQSLKILLLDDMPGGSEAFELVSKFCYGVIINLTAAVISSLRCAAEYLEMTEDFEEGNLIFKTEAFLSYVVMSSWKDSIVVLKTCYKLSPWAENLQIVRRCSESIAWKACANPKTIRWPYTGSFNAKADTNHEIPENWWFEDVSVLKIDHFVRVITAIKVKGMRFELVGASVMRYAEKWLPGFSKGMSIEAKSSIEFDMNYNSQDTMTVTEKDQRLIIESLISIIPPQRGTVPCRFLLRLLKMAIFLNVSQALVTELEKRVGMQLDEATHEDLLIPTNGKTGDQCLFDVDLVQRILEHFIVQEHTDYSSANLSHGEITPCEESQPENSLTGLMKVARLLDNYLADISRDQSLSPTKFQVLAEALPESARICDDGLYRAIDSYLKAHPSLSEYERKRLCRVMDCQKLSSDACMHVAQNERLPLRIVVQVLFSEQIKITTALANRESNHKVSTSNRKTLLEGTPQSFQEGWAAAIKDISALKFEIESVKAKYLELQNDMESLERQITKPKQTSGWTSGWKKLSKFGKMTNLETNETYSPTVTKDEKMEKKKPRKWRNSIS